MSESCDNADKNPVCPYLSNITQQGKDIKLIKKALMGDDMQGGIVAEIQKFKMLWKILIFVSGVTITSLVALAVKLLK